MQSVKKNLAGGLDYPAVVGRLRQVLGVTSDEALGKRLDVTRQTILNWKKGEGLTLQTLVQFAEATRAPLVWLLFGIGMRRGKGGTAYAVFDLLVAEFAEALSRFPEQERYPLTLRFISDLARSVEESSLGATIKFDSPEDEARVRGSALQPGASSKRSRGNGDAQ